MRPEPGLGGHADPSLSYPADDPGDLLDAAVRCARLAGFAVDARAGLTALGVGLQGAWEGSAARGCHDELVAASATVAAVVPALHGAVPLFRRHAEVLASARAEIDGLRRELADLLEARRHALAVEAAAGSATLAALPALPSSGHRGEPVGLRDQAARAVAAEQVAALAALRARHAAVLDQVRLHARGTGGGLALAAADVLPHVRSQGHGGKSHADLPSSNGGVRGVGDQEAQLVARLPLLAAARLAAGVTLAGPAPATGTPADQVRQWWSALTTDEQQRVVRQQARAVGGLDGLPAAVRSAANEQRLGAAVARLAGRSDPTEAEARLLATCLLLRALLAKIRGHRDPASLVPDTAALLVWRPAAYAAQGRAALVVGDLDRADNVAVLVPGFGTDVRGSMHGMTTDALRVTDQARREVPDQTTATVAWVGYDAPGVLGVGFSAAARAGAVVLAHDLLGLQAARSLPPHLTVVGHSYGSTTAGTALRDDRTGADDLVLLGSPGAGVDRATAFGLGPGHVFVGASSRDPVSYLERFGTDPTHAGFGGVRFRAEDPTRSPWHLAVGDHLKYYNAGSESLTNIVHVVVGEGSDVTLADYRPDVPWRPEGISDDPETYRVPKTR